MLVLPRRPGAQGREADLALRADLSGASIAPALEAER